MGVEIIGLDKLLADLREVDRLIRGPGISFITRHLAEGMRKHVHIDTKYLRSTIYHKKKIAGAKAAYAGYEEERGSSHAYATKAINDFHLETYADFIWRPLDGNA